MIDKYVPSTNRPTDQPTTAYKALPDYFLYFLVFHLSCSDVLTEDNLKSRAGKFLNFFQIVTCATQDGSEESGGVCYSPWECSERGGQEMGNCASGFGRCCVIQNTDDK